MVAKLFLLQFAIFRQGFVGLARNDFRRNSITVQLFRLPSSPCLKIAKFRYEIVL
jgi:hypothetical protein